MRIVTEHIAPPIGTTRYDWSAVEDGYEPGDPIGYGRTKAEAIEDLMERIAERDE